MEEAVRGEARGVDSSMAELGLGGLKLGLVGVKVETLNAC